MGKKTSKEAAKVSKVYTTEEIKKLSKLGLKVEILNERKLNKIDLIKIDTEGHEYEVLEGMKNSIKKINYILIEFHIDKIYESYDSNIIHEILIKNNFKLLKRFKFPFTTWQDCLYINLNLNN